MGKKKTPNQVQTKPKPNLHLAQTKPHLLEASLGRTVLGPQFSSSAPARARGVALYLYPCKRRPRSAVRPGFGLFSLLVGLFFLFVIAYLVVFSHPRWLLSPPPSPSFPKYNADG